MILTKRNIENIHQRFNEIETRRDFLALINHTNKLINGEDFKPTTLKELTYYSITEHRDKSYKRFSINKKSGKKRDICSPKNELKNLQKAISLILQSVYTPNDSAKGFVLGTSVVDNAKVHLNQNYVFNIDLKDFFSSIEQARVWACLKLAPFNLNDDDCNKDELKIEYGIKLLETDHGEKIFYSIDTNKKNKDDWERSQSLSFIPGLKDDKEIFFKRIDKENQLIIDRFSDGKNINWELVEKNGYKLPLEALADLVFSERNISKLRKLQISRQLINNIISNLSCTELEVERKDNNGKTQRILKNVLPQGAPTSPVLSNIVCQRLDFLLSGLAKRFNLKYTRYADDITFSSMHNIYNKNSAFIQELERIITDQGFEIKDSKTRLQSKAFRQEVTGIVVNEKLNVRKRYIKELRMWLYYWDKYGYKKADSLFRKDYIKDKGHVKNNNVKLENVVLGKLEYLKMVKGSSDTTYKTLNKKFIKVKGKSNSVNKVLDIWEKEGIENAIKHYKKIGLEYIELKKYLSQIVLDDIQIHNDRINLLEENEIIDTLIVSKKSRALISESQFIEYLNSKSSASNWYIAHNKFKNVKFLFMKNWAVASEEEISKLLRLNHSNK